MDKSKFELQPAIKKETKNVAVYTLAGIVIMYVGFVLYKFLLPIESKVNYGYFDYRIFLGAICGGIVAVLNFFFMALAVQRVTSVDDDKVARSIMKKSYSQRMLLQIVWVIVAIAAECFQPVAGILPLLFPTLGIKLKGIIDVKKSLRQEVDRKQDGN